MRLVSVVIGTYNGASYIKEQLDSILAQTYSPLEIIIVDDASKDNTVAILQDYSQKYNNIKVYDFKTNVGYIKNFERGIALTKGKHIALSDQDDWWMPTKIEALMNNINHYELVYCDSDFVDADLKLMGNRFSNVKNLVSIDTPINLLIDNCVSGHASLFKKSLFEKAIPFPENIPHDWWLAYVASLEEGILYVDEPLVKYRHHQHNVIASAKKNKKDKSKKRSKRQKFEKRKLRIKTFYAKCPDHLKQEKKLILKIKKSYHSFSLPNNLNRVFLFYSNRKELLKILKRSNFSKIVYILNMFFRIK